MTDRHTAQHNRLLAALPDSVLIDLSPHLLRVPLAQGETLFEPGDTIADVHFPLSGMVSIVALMDDGTAVETATIGPEGAVGLVQAMGTGRVFWRAIVQLPGEALRIESSHLRAIGAVNDTVGVIATRYTEALMMQVLQLVACNALHGVEARLARWLLTCRDCAGEDRLPLTQEFLAEMLGVSRTTVTQTARGLKGAKLITYRRGGVRILDKAGLERCACECRTRIQRGFDALLPVHGEDEARD